MEVRGYKTEVALGKSLSGSVFGSLEGARQHFSRGCLSLFLLLPGLATAAGYVPNAGQAMRDIESTQPALPEPAEPELDLPAVKPPSAPAPDTSGIRLEVNDFVLVGNQAFSSQTLLPLLADLKGQELDLNQLRAAAERLTTYYQSQGYMLARAFLPAQDIEDGVVRIEVIEGRYGRIELHNQSRALDSVIRGPLSSLQSEAPVLSDDLERSLLLLSDLPGVRVKGTLRAGEQRGTTDLLINAQPGPWASGSLEADNYGGYYTGEYRLGGSLNLNNPLRLGDQLNLRVLGSDADQRYYRAAYKLPVGPWSTSLGLAYSQMTYELGKVFELLEAHGQASIGSVFVTQPLIRSRTFDLSAQLQYEDKRLRDDIDLFEVSSKKHVELWSLGLNGNFQDSLLGGGQTFFYLTYGSGRLSLDDPGDQWRDHFTSGTAGGFQKFNLNAARLQYLSPRFQLYTQLNAQWASANLDSSEKFGVGGPFDVRAYPQGTGSGDQGWQASLELRYALAPRWQLKTFVDHGAVQVNKRPWTREENRRQLSGAGVGASWSGPSQQISVTSAWPLDTSKEGSGPERTPRIWASATQYF